MDPRGLSRQLAALATGNSQLTERSPRPNDPVITDAQSFTIFMYLVKMLRDGKQPPPSVTPVQRRRILAGQPPGPPSDRPGGPGGGGVDDLIGVGAGFPADGPDHVSAGQGGLTPGAKARREMKEVVGSPWRPLGGDRRDEVGARRTHKREYNKKNKIKIKT